MARTSSVRGGVDLFPAGGTRLGFSERISARLQPSEKLLRRLVLALISLFFIVTVAGSISHIIYGKARALATAYEDLTLLADAIAARFQLAGPEQSKGVQNALAANLPARATLAGRIVLIANPDGVILATAPYDLSRIDKTIAEVVGSAQPLLAFAAEAGVLPSRLHDGREAIVTVRNIDNPTYQLAIYQPRELALQAWWREAVFDITIFATTGLLLILISAAFLSQSAGVAITGDRLGALKDFDPALFANDCGLWDWNIARGLVRWSGSMFKMLGQEPSDEPIAFREVAKSLQGDIDLYAIVERAMADGIDTIDQTFRIRDASGEWQQVRLAGRVVRDETRGEPHLIAALSRTGKTEAEGAWSAAADVTLRDAIESISEAFVLWDSENRLVLCNSKYQQFHNLSEANVIPGTPYEQVLSAASEPIIRKRIEVAGDDPHARTYEAQLEDNRWLHVDERRTKNGGYVCVSTDITSLKLNEQKLSEHKRELEESVSDLRKSQHELEIQKQQLVDLTEKYALEKNRAEAANRSKSQFLANFSHELRTPLNAVLGFSEVMQNALFGPLGNKKYEEYARDIHESGSYLLQVINDILDMSKIEAGRIKLRIEHIDLGEIIEDSIPLVAEVASKRNVKLKRGGLSSMEIEADRRALKQTLLNLLSNAVKFTPDGGEVRIRLARAAKGRAKIVITDTGIGIPEAELDKLGKPFEQVENQFTMSHKGSGLGLAISRSLMEMHGGHIEISSKEGKGTTVTCMLPIQPILSPTEGDTAA